MADKIQILKKGAFFMDEIEIQKKCQTYEVTDFQHNFEINHPTTMRSVGLKEEERNLNMVMW